MQEYLFAYVFLENVNKFNINVPETCIKLDLVNSLVV